MFLHGRTIGHCAQISHDGRIWKWRIMRPQVDQKSLVAHEELKCFSNINRKASWSTYTGTPYQMESSKKMQMSQKLATSTSQN